MEHVDAPKPEPVSRRRRAFAGVGAGYCLAVALSMVPTVGCSALVDSSIDLSDGIDAGTGAGNLSCAKLGPTEDASAFVVGAILPFEGEYASIGLPMRNAVELAVIDINEWGGVGGGRQLAVVACDSSGNTDQALEAARYLVDGVGVPAIIGPAFSGAFIEVSTRVTIPANVLTISPSATTPSIKSLDDRNLAWRTAASDEFQGVAISDLVRTLGYTDIVVMGKGDAYGRGLLNQVNLNLGQSLSEDHYFGSEYDDPGNQTNPDFSGPIDAALEAIRLPDVVLLLGTSEVADLMRLFEANLPAGTSSTSLPQYIFADGGKVDETLAQISTNLTLKDRIRGTEPDHQNPELYRRFSLSYDQRFGSTPGIYTTNSYDAAYLLAFSAMRAGAMAGGPELAAALGAMSSGTKVSARPEEIADARTRLEAGESIDFSGVSGPLDFDASGEAPANVSLWKIGTQTNGTLRFDPTPAGSYVIGSDGKGSWTLAE